MQDLEISKIILGTGNYENVKSGNTVSITDDGGNSWGYFGPNYKKLAPRLFTYTDYIRKKEELLELKDDVSKLQEYLELKKYIEEEYIKSYYETRLKDLDIKKFLYMLKENFGDNIIFLCHEPIDEFCHRRVFADYIEILTNIYIPEISVSHNGKIKELNPIRYIDILKKIM